MANCIIIFCPALAKAFMKPVKYEVPDSVRLMLPESNTTTPHQIDGSPGRDSSIFQLRTQGVARMQQAENSFAEVMGYIQSRIVCRRQALFTRMDGIETEQCLTGTFTEEAGICDVCSALEFASLTSQGEITLSPSVKERVNGVNDSGRHGISGRIT